VAEPLRILLFPSNPGALLVVVTDDDQKEVALPPLPVPFTKENVAAALRGAAVSARIGEEVSGRWSAALRRAQSDARAERGQREMVRQATTVALAAGSTDVIARSRGELLQQKLRVDAEIADLKKQVAAARNAATRGIHMPAEDLRLLVERLGEAKNVSQAVQVKLGELREEEKKRNVARTADYQQRFIRSAREMLDPEDFAALCAAAEDEGDEGDEE